jgi:hypothetical protein
VKLQIFTFEPLNPRQRFSVVNAAAGEGRWPDAGPPKGLADLGSYFNRDKSIATSILSAGTKMAFALK